MSNRFLFHFKYNNSKINNSESMSLPMSKSKSKINHNLISKLFCVFLFCLFALTCPCSAENVQLTFELPDNENQCFYDQISKGVVTVVEYQVVTGGNYDVDMIMKSPSGKVLYQDQKKQYDSFRYEAQEDGIYEVCFSNEFSTFTHKIVFLDWQIGEEAPVLGLGL
jgi:hypothetical protein